MFKECDMSKNISFKDINGNVIEDWEAEVRFDNEKLDKKKELDGFYIIETNIVGVNPKHSHKGNWSSRWNKDILELELNQEVNTHEIIEMYRGLW